MKSIHVTSFAATAAVLLAGCAGASDPSAQADDVGADEAAARTPTTVVIDAKFDGSSAEGFTTGFADYPKSNEGIFELESGLRPLPTPFTGGGILLSGHNRSDDLWMYTTRGLRTTDGIVANTRYDVQLTVWIASNAPSDCFGIGGSPGGSLFIKGHVVGAAATTKVVNDFVTFSLDKGAQSNIGSQALDLGTLANGDPCEGDVSNAPYKIIERAAASTTPVRATRDGKLWLYVGTDSGFEGKTTYYVDRVRAVLTPRR